METNKQDLNALLNSLTAENDDHKKAIKVHERAIKENDPLIRALSSKLGVALAASKNSGYGNTLEAVKAAIKQTTKSRFTADDIANDIRDANPDMMISRANIKSAMWTLAKSKKELIKQVREGTNRQPAEFEKLVAANGGQNGSFHPNLEANRRSVGLADNSGQITVGAFEDFISKKNRRMKDVLAQFNVSESTARKLLEPASRVYEGEKGWLKLRE